MRRLLLLIAALNATGCGTPGEAEPVSVAPSRRLLIAADLSGSQTPKRLADAREIVSRAIDGLQNGDDIILMQVHRGAAAEDEAIRWTESIAPAMGRRITVLDREEVVNIQRAAKTVADHLFDSAGAGQVPTTDLFATLHIAAEYRRDDPSKSMVILLVTDMLQSAHGIEMASSSGVPSARWIASQKERGLIPDLSGACISVVGADATTPGGLKVQEFWVEYFAATGARLPDGNYRLLTMQNPLGACARS